MGSTMKLSPKVLGLVFLASLGACKKGEFKGSTATRSIPKPQEAIGENSAVPKEDHSAAMNPDIPVIGDELSSIDVEIPKVVSKKPQQVSASFKASATVSDTFAFTLDTKSSSSSFTLTDLSAAKKESHSQKVRTAVTDSFQQGTAGQAVTENFRQDGQKGLVDILIVVDDSGSMDVEQKELGQRLASLLTSIQGSQWQIGVITSSVQTNDTCRLSLIDSTETNASEKFKTAVTPGITGSGKELGVKQAVTGLKCLNAPWLRADATTAVLIVSDEDNCSKDGEDCGNNPWGKESYLIDYLEKDLRKELWKNAGIYGIFSPPSEPCATAQNIGTQYARLMAYKNPSQTRKNVGNICDTNYSATLNQISADIALLLKSQFEIRAIPDSGSLKLSVDGISIPQSHFTFSGQTISFAEGRQPANGKTLKVEYVVGARPLFKSVNLKNDAVPETLSVKVGAAILPPSAYTLSGRTLTFLNQPSDLATVVVDYRIQGSLINSFQLEKLPLASSLMVTVDAKPATGMSYDASQNQISFNPAPTDGARVEINYLYRTGPKLVYTVSSINGSSNHKVYDGANLIPFTKNGDSYTIQAEDHSLAKTLTLLYDAPDEAARTFELAHLPLKGSELLSKDIASCKLGSGIAIRGSQLTANCAVSQRSDFELQYSYLEKYDMFSLSVPEPERGTWEVSINGKPFTEALRTGNSIKIDFERYLNLDSVIEIRYTFPE